MDVQSDAVDPPSSESQPSGKKKGFKLFGKRKPGSIFSIRGRAEEKEAAAAAKSKALEGSPENTPSPPPEQEPETEHASSEVRGGPGPNGQALQDEETSMMAAAPSRPSICSMGSVRSMGFLLRLRGSGKGGRGGGGAGAAGERQVQTVSQPPSGRQRRGIKGLFSGVKFPANKSDQEEERAGAAPGPPLMSSRSNSVEIIKEDMTLTPRPPPRSHNSSSESEGTEADGARHYGSAVVPRTPVSLGPGTPQEPGDAGLSFLLSDISSLLTFDSITAGGDIMADVAAEWDKASAAISAARDSEGTPPPSASPSPKPAVRSSPAARYAPAAGALTTTTTTAKAATTRTPAVPPPTPPRSFTATVKPGAAPSLFAPSGPTDAKSSSALSSHPFKPPPAAVPSTFITVRSSAQKPAAAPPPSSSSSLVTLTSFSTPPVKTSTLITSKPLYPASTCDPAPTKPPAGVTPPYRSPLTTLSSVATVKPPAEAAAPAWEPGHAAPAPFTFTPVAYSLPSNLPFSGSDQLDSRNGPSYQSSSAKQPPYVLSSFTSGESKASVLLPCPVQARLPSSAPPAVLPKTTAVLPPAPLPPLPPCVPSLVTSDKYAPSFVAPSVASSFSSTPTPMSSTKPPSIPAPVPPRTTSITPAAQPAVVPAHLEKTPSVPASTPLPTSQAAAPSSTLSSSPRPPAPASTAPTLASKTPPLPLPPPFFTTTPITPTPSPVSPTPSPVSPTPSPVSPTPAPMSCFPASKAPTSSFAVPSPIIPITRTPDPPVTKPAPAAPSITPTPAPMSCTPASKPPISASVIPTPIAPTPSPVLRTPDAIVTKPAPITPTPVSIPVSLPKTSPPPATIAPGPGRVQAAMEPLPGMNDRGAQQPARREETIPAPAEPQQTSLPGPVKDKRPTPGKLVGLSKIPIVGGGRAVKPPVRDAHPQPHGDDGDRSPDSLSTPGPTPGPTPASSPVDERPRLSPQDGRGRVGAGVPTSRQPHHPEESQHPQHPQPPRAIASSPRDSKIPVKHGAQLTSQSRDPPRSKIPTSKVPVRRLGASKPAVASTTAPQMRK